MNYALLTLTALASLACALWITVYSIAIWNLRRSTMLRDIQPDPERTDWPLVSIIIAARDEEDDIADTIETLLRSDYPALEVVAVNDRSTDATGEIIADMATRDSRLRAVHIKTLPEGWLGKVHALEAGVQEAANAKWLLFTDADVKQSPLALKRSVTLAGKWGLDHLVLFPRMTGASFMLEAAFSAFSIMFMAGTKAYRIHRPDSDAFIGVGAFNLVRRKTLMASEGFQWLRMEVADDLGLGLLTRRAGARQRFAFAADEVFLTWYTDVPSMMRGMSKNLFSAAKYSYLRLAFIIPALLLFGLAPLSLFVPDAPIYLKALSGTALLLSGVLGSMAKGIYTERMLPHLLSPCRYPRASPWHLLQFKLRLT